MESENAISESSITVAVRIKPLKSGQTYNLNVEDGAIRIETGRRSEVRRYKFDHFFDTDASQRDVYDSIGEPLVKNVLSGYNHCLFAFGQTGSGKTYTMTGVGKDWSQVEGEKFEAIEGIIPRICRSLMEARRSSMGVIEIKVSAVEIFLEKMYDLLSPDAVNSINSQGLQRSTYGPNSSRVEHYAGVTFGQTLRIREHPERGWHVSGATIITVKNFSDVLCVLRRAAEVRSVAATDMNSRSSRSHAIYTIYISRPKEVIVNAADKNTQHARGDEVDENDKMRNQDAGVTSCSSSQSIRVYSKACLVDLAGSENARALHHNGHNGGRSHRSDRICNRQREARMRESGSINTSLLALGRVIAALAKRSVNKKKLPSNGVGVMPTSSSNSFSTPAASAAAAAAAQLLSHGQEEEEKQYKQEASSAPFPPQAPTRPCVIPYRDSQLTMLLRDSLGGASFATIIATLRADVEVADETASTLRFAVQAHSVTTAPSSHSDNPYLSTIIALRKEIASLKLELAGRQYGGSCLEDTSSACTTTSNDTDDVIGAWGGVASGDSPETRCHEADSHSEFMSFPSLNVDILTTAPSGKHSPMLMQISPRDILQKHLSKSKMQQCMNTDVLEQQMEPAPGISTSTPSLSQDTETAITHRNLLRIGSDGLSCTSSDVYYSGGGTDFEGNSSSPKIYIRGKQADEEGQEKAFPEVQCEQDMDAKSSFTSVSSMGSDSVSHVNSMPLGRTQGSIIDENEQQQQQQQQCIVQ